MEAATLIGVILAVGGGLGAGFTLGAHFNPGARALQNACRSLKQQNNQLQRELAEAAEVPAAQGGGGGMEAIGAILSSGEFDLRSIAKAVMANPDLLKVALGALSGKASPGTAGGAAAAQGAGAGAAGPRPATHI